MNVKLLQQPEKPQRIAALAARLCYSASDIETISEKMDDAAVSGFLKKVISLGHHSVMEHISYTFGVEGISRACSHQLVRHRLASYSQQSQRYVKFDSPAKACVIPPSIDSDKELREKYLQALNFCAETYSEFLEKGIPAEDARFLLPNGAETKIIMTMNARELLHFFSLRCCERAQWEIRAMACEMLKLVKPTAPIIFENAGPGCVGGACPEGSMTCGKGSEIRAKFKDIR